MNANELHEIMKDAPQAVLPKGLVLGAVRHQWLLSGKLLQTDHAAMLFEASMIRWLIGEGFHSFEWDSDSDAGSVMLTLYDREFVDKSGRDSHIKLLAAACVERASTEKGGGR